MFSICYVAGYYVLLNQNYSQYGFIKSHKYFINLGLLHQKSVLFSNGK